MPLLFALLLACSTDYPAADFLADRAEVTCALYSDCAVLELYGWADAASCQADLVASWTCTEVTDPDVGVGCVEGIAAMSCEQLYDEAWPATCDTACAGGAAQAQDTGG
ncbi:MAG: hypothetical protein H6742_05270 [Alphaproteobacteria bacterium]|nr:hypothetical protein [Alphaproteobacteria bacterium]